VRIALILSIVLMIFVTVVSIRAKRDTSLSNIVSITSILEPSLGVDSFNSRFLKRSNDATNAYPMIEKFNRMDIVYE